MAKSGQAPFGYKRARGRFMADPDEAKICREIFELFIEHKRLKSVVDIVNNHNLYRTPTNLACPLKQWPSHL